jgi:hypothetical protein
MMLVRPVDNIIKPPLERLISKPKFTAEELAQMHQQVNGVVAHEPSVEKPMRAFPTTLRAPLQVEEPASGEASSFWTSCLGGLCIPSTAGQQPEVTLVEKQPEEAAEMISPKVKRKPVVFDLETTSPDPTPVALPDRILQNHLALQEHFGKLTLSPPPARPQMPLPSDAAMCHLSEVQYKRLAAFANSLTVDAMSGALAPTAEYEYIYVFRLDGDHIWTPEISLKIGRTSSVERRLKQWTRQCKQQVDFLDSFPTLYAPLLERLIHLELQEVNVRRTCEGCGSVHREWFTLDRDTARGRVRRCVDRWETFLHEVHASQLTAS